MTRAHISVLASATALLFTVTAFAVSTTGAAPASGASPGTVGAMQGVEPAPGVGASGPAPKLVRKTPGNRDTTQPPHGANAASSGMPASSPGDKTGGK